MFLQVIRGRTSDPAGVRRLMDRWVEELGPDAPGWLGTTAGVTASGELVAVVRFASEEQARANSERAEQGAWFAEFAKHLDADPSFADCAETSTFLSGGSDDAGFVQVMQSQVTDRRRAREAGETMRDLPPDAFGRPDLVGGTVALHDGEDVVTQVAYFTSEAEARRYEAQEPPEAARQAMAEWEDVFAETSYYDLSEPWLASPT